MTELGKVSEGEIGPRLVVFSLLLYLGALLLRSWSNLSTPGLYVEDATLHFNFYYGGDNPLASVLQRPHGYYNLFDNLVAWAVAKVDVRLQAATYLAVGLVCAVTTSTCLLFSGLFRTKWVLFVAPTVLGLVGMNHIFYYITLTYLIYVLVVLLICLMFFRPPRSTLGFVLLCLLYVLLIWSGGYSVVAVPTALVFFLVFEDKRRRALMAWAIVCTLAYASTAGGLIRLENLLDTATLGHMLRTLVDDVIFLGWIEHPFARALVVVALGAVIYQRRGDAYLHRYSLILATVVLSSLMPLFLSVKYEAYPNPYPCHVFIAQFFWLVWCLLALDRLLLTKRARGWIPAATAAAFLVLVYVDNRAVPSRGWARPMTEVGSFLEAVHFVEQLELEKRHAFVTLRVPNRRYAPKVKVGSWDSGGRRIGRSPELREVRRFVQR